jgi:hypothetical protein
VYVVAGDAGHTYFSMFAFFPIEILLVAVTRFPARPKTIGITVDSGLVEKQPYVGFSLINLIFDRISILAALVMPSGVT